MTLRFLVIVQGRHVVHVHMVGASLHVDNGCAFEEVGEGSRVHGGGGDDEFQILPALQEQLHVTQQKVDIEAAFVSLIQDDGMVLPQVAVRLCFRQQNTVCHQLDSCLRRGRVVKAHLVAHEAAGGAAHFLRQAARYGYGGQSARLGAAQSAGAVACYLQRNFGQLRGLAAAGFAHHDHDAMPPQGLGYLLPVAGDGEVRVSKGGRWGHGELFAPALGDTAVGIDAAVAEEWPDAAMVF